MKVEPLRLVIVTQGVSRVVMPLVEGKHRVVGIMESVPRNFVKNPWRFRLYCFIRDFARLLSRAPAGLRQYCEKRDIPFRLLFTSKDRGLIGWVEQLKPDLIVIYGMSCLLSESVVRISRLGAINLHPSFLPDYRGPNPDFWQYYDMVTEPGVTVHFIDKGEDTGAILAQKRVHIPLGMKSTERLDRLIGIAGVPILLACIDKLSLGVISVIRQPASSGTDRARNLSQSEHKQIIDFQTWPAERVWNLLCGTEDWLNALPAPTGLFWGQRWSIGDLRKDVHLKGVPGSIVDMPTGRFLICRDGVVELGLHFSFKRLVGALLRWH